MTLDAVSAAAQRAVRHGLGRVIDGRVVITDPDIARALSAADDPEQCLQLMTEVLDTTGEVIDDLAVRTVAVLRSGSPDGIEDITKRALLNRLQITFDQQMTALLGVRGVLTAIPGWWPGRRQSVGPAIPGSPPAASAWPRRR